MSLGNRTGAVVRRRKMHLRRSAAVLAFVIGLAACNSGSTPADLPNSGIHGTVTVGPQCPVVHAESPCPDAPFEGTVQVSQTGKGVVADVLVDAAGAYRIALEPGTYVVTPVLAGQGGPPTTVPATVVVRVGTFTRVDLTVDSGIR